MDRRAFLATAGAAFSVSLAGCGQASGLSGDEFDVGMSSNAFLPRTHEVAVGGTVVWGNNSSRPHTVTAYENAIPEGAAFFASGGFDSQGAAQAGWRDGEGAIDPGQTYEHTFEVPGTHNYFCIPHEPAGMVGKVVVTE